jgi:hypothetical protein
VAHKVATQTFTVEECDSFEQNVVGLAGYAAVLYRTNVIDRNLFLARASEFISVAFYIYEPALTNFLRTGLLHRDSIRMARDALAFRNKIPREFDPYPDLWTYSIPPDLGS